jgi:hypothetical protein
MNVKQTLFIAIAISFAIPQTTFAQAGFIGAPNSTLRTPLISGSSSAPPFVSPPEGQSPACGDGMSPSPVLPGHGGPPTLLPWIPSIPSNQIDRQTSGIPLPVNPAVEMPPGVLGPLLTPVIPAPPSTPGMDPGSLTAPMGSFNPSQEIPIIPTGGIPGTGGFLTTIPTVRRGGQQTHQWELRGRNSSLGNIFPGDGSQDQVELLGPMAGWGVPFGVATGNGLRNNSLDLGGGQRFAVGGNRISTGSTVQDFGLSSMRNNPIGALDGNQSFEFGQGRRRMPRFTNKTSDFGFPYAQFAPCNTNPQKMDQLLLPTAVITNF